MTEMNFKIQHSTFKFQNSKFEAAVPPCAGRAPVYPPQSRPKVPGPLRMQLHRFDAVTACALVAEEARV
jgi:hypothetical protein